MSKTEPAVVLSFKMPFGITVMRKHEDPAVWHDITGASAVSITRIDALPADTFLREQITELIDDPEIDMATRELLAEILKAEQQ